MQLIKNLSYQFNIIIDRVFKNDQRKVLLIILFFGCLKLTLIDSINLGNADEGYYINAASMMRETGDFLIPKYYWGPDRLNKPILIYWLSAIGQTIGPSDLVGSRLVTWIFGIGLLYISYLLGKLFFPKLNNHFLIPLLLASTIQFNKYVLDIIPEITFVFFVCLSQYSFWKAFLRINENRNSKKWVIIFYGVIGIGFMIKGPGAIIFPLLTALSFLIISRNINLLSYFISPVGWILFFSIVAPWYLYLYSIYGSDLFITFFHREILQRITVVHQLWRKLSIPVNLFPWSIIFILCPILGYKKGKKLSNELLYIWCWFISTLSVILFVVQEYHAHYNLDFIIPGVLIAFSYISQIPYSRIVRLLPWFISLILMIWGLFFLIVSQLLQSAISNPASLTVYSLLMIILSISIVVIIRSGSLSLARQVFLISIPLIVGQTLFYHALDKLTWPYSLAELIEKIEVEDSHSMLVTNERINWDLSYTWTSFDKKVGGMFAGSMDEFTYKLSDDNKMDIRYALCSYQTYADLPKHIRDNWTVIAEKFYLRPDFSTLHISNYYSSDSFTEKSRSILRFLKSSNPEDLFYKYVLITKRFDNQSLPKSY